jgi:hypothetical protein
VVGEHEVGHELAGGVVADDADGAGEERPEACGVVDEEVAGGADLVGELEPEVGAVAPERGGEDGVSVAVVEGGEVVGEAGQLGGLERFERVDPLPGSRG